MRNYYRLMLGRKSVFAEACLAGDFIGVDFEIMQDLTGRVHSEWREFNKEYVPIFLRTHPHKSRIAAGLACGALWTLCEGMQEGDIVLCPDGQGTYHVGEIAGGYYYAPNEILFHRRRVTWLKRTIERSAMSEGLRNSAGVPLTLVGPNAITACRQEIEALIGTGATPSSVNTGLEGEIIDNAAFAMERHLEDFLVENWAQTELGRDYDVYSEDGEPFGKQYPTDTGPMDILAISKDRRRLLVVELKKGRAGDAVVGQTLRYMGFVKEELAESDQSVLGVIIAMDDDHRLRRAISMTPDISFFRYQLSFKLIKG
jgi:restriction system protein